MNVRQLIVLISGFSVGFQIAHVKEGTIFEESPVSAEEAAEVEALEPLPSGASRGPASLGGAVVDHSNPEEHFKQAAQELSLDELLSMVPSYRLEFESKKRGESRRRHLASLFEEIQMPVNEAGAVIDNPLDAYLRETKRQMAFDGSVWVMEGSYEIDDRLYRVTAFMHLPMSSSSTLNVEPEKRCLNFDLTLEEPSGRIHDLFKGFCGSEGLLVRNGAIFIGTDLLGMSPQNLGSSLMVEMPFATDAHRLAVVANDRGELKEGNMSWSLMSRERADRIRREVSDRRERSAPKDSGN